MGRQARTDKELQRLKGEHNSCFTQAEQRKTSTDDPRHLVALSTLRHASAGGCRDWVLKLGFQRRDLGED